MRARLSRQAARLCGQSDRHLPLRSRGRRIPDASGELSDRWQLFGQASLVWLGEGDLLPELQEDYAGSLLAGVTWQATAAFELTGQLEANTAVFDTGTDLDGDAVVLTLGGAFRSAGGWRFDLGFSEDVAVNASPDFVIVAGVGRSF